MLSLNLSYSSFWCWYFKIKYIISVPKGNLHLLGEFLTPSVSLVNSDLPTIYILVTFCFHTLFESFKNKSMSQE